MELRKSIKANLSAIKKLVFEDQVAEEKAFVDAKTANGDILKIEPAIEVGATVMVITEDGEEAPAPEGSYELEDGSVITIADGILSNVEPLEAPAEEDMAAQPEGSAGAVEVKPFDMDALHKQIIDKLNTSIIDKIDKLRFAKVEDVEALKAENEKLREGFKVALDVIEELAGAESVEPTTKVKPNAFKKKTNGRLTITQLKELTK